MYWYCGTYSYTEVLVSTTKHILVLHILLVLRSISRSYGTSTCLIVMGVPIGTTELVLIYNSTRRYYRTKSETGVPVGTTELIQMQEYP